MVELDERLQRDCFVLGRLEFCQLLLLDNAAVPWFVLLPDTAASEICDLDADLQNQLWQEVNRVALYLREAHAVDKINIGAIGNIVRQLHVHVVGRREDDYCWPGVVWGTVPPARYTGAQVERLKQDVANKLKGLSL